MLRENSSLFLRAPAWDGSAWQVSHGLTEACPQAKVKREGDTHIP